MKAVQETTDWGESNIPNHIYILNDADGLVGYVKSGTNEPVKFKKPMNKFSKSRRQFKTLKSYDLTFFK